MTNKYLQRIEEMGLEKQAFDPITFGATALGTHVAQNGLTHLALRNKAFGASVADHFHAGLHGRVAPSSVASNKTLLGRVKDTLNTDVRDLFGKTVNSTYVAGGINPELNILKDEAYHAGHQFRKELSKHGFTPENMTPEMKEVFSHTLKGNFTHLKSKWIDDPLAQRVISSYEKATGRPVTAILRGTDEGIAEAEKVWKKNPLTGNIASQIGDFRDVSHLPKGHSQPSTHKSLAGTAVTSTVLGLATGHGMPDIALAGINTLKAGLADKRLTSVVPSLKKPVDRLQDFFVDSGLRSAAEKGLEGRAINKPYNLTKRVLASNLMAEGQDLTNKLTMAANKGNVKDVVAEGKYLMDKKDQLVGEAKDLYEKGQKAYQDTKPIWDSISGKVSKRLSDIEKANKSTPTKEPNKYLERLGIGGGVAAGGLGGIGIARYNDKNQQPISA